MPDDDDDDDDNYDDDDDDNALSQIFNELNNVLLLRQPQQGSPHEGHVFAVQLPAACCLLQLTMGHKVSVACHNLSVAFSLALLTCFLCPLR